MQTPRVTPDTIEFMKHYEGFKNDASPCVSGKRHPDGTLMYDIGYGCQFWENGDPVLPGDTIDSFKAEQLMQHWIAAKKEPAIERYMGEVTFSPPMWNALVSMWYNLRNVTKQPIMQALRDGVYGQHVEMTRELADRWVLYCDPKSPGIRKGLYRRRVGEVLLARSLPDPYENSQTLEYKQDFWPLVERLEDERGWSMDTIEWEPADPTPDTPMTTEDANYLAMKRSGSTMTFEEFRGLVREKDVIDVPNLKPDAKPKRAEDSKTVNGIAKQKAAREQAVTGGVLAAVTTSLPAVTAITGYLEEFSTSAIVWTFMVIGFLLIGVGFWRWWRGKIITYEGRQETTQPKV